MKPSIISQMLPIAAMHWKVNAISQIRGKRSVTVEGFDTSELIRPSSVHLEVLFE